MKIFGYIMWGIIIFDFIFIFFIPPLLLLSMFLVFENRSSRRYAEKSFSLYPWDENRTAILLGMDGGLYQGLICFKFRRKQSNVTLIHRRTYKRK